MKLPSCFVVRGLLCLVCPYSFLCLPVSMFVLFYESAVFFVGKVHPKLKRRYHAHLGKVREYLETVKDFDELISPQSLFFHFLGPEPSSNVRKDIETVKKSECANDISFFFFFFFSLFFFFLISPPFF